MLEADISLEMNWEVKSFRAVKNEISSLSDFPQGKKTMLWI